MAQAIRSEQFTPGDVLRDLLTDCEEQLPNLKGRGADVVQLLHDLDRIAELWPQLEASGFDLRPEAGRWETIQALVHKQAATIVREAGGAGAYARLRSRQPGDGSAGWWWQLDHEVRQNRITRLRRTAVSALAIVLVSAAVIFVLNKLIPTDPNYQAAISKQMAGQRDIEERGDFESAIRSFEEATALIPDDAEPWLWLGATQQRVGNLAAAEASFARARQNLGQDLEFYIQRGMVYMGVRLLDEAGADLDAALAIDPEEPRAYLYLGGLYEMQGQIVKAIEALERASELSDKRDMPQLTAVSRYRLAMLYQQAQSIIAQPAAATPTPR
jgi:cytochrome c-type biogenesis protein CcmH/NrfG